MHILDTNICIYVLTRRVPSVTERFRSMSPGELGTTFITVAELRYGALHSARPRENLARLTVFLAPLVKLPFDDASAAHFARIKNDLARDGKPIGPMDLLIAATTRSRDATLVTNNVSEFLRVPSLRVENWK